VVTNVYLKYSLSTLFIDVSVLDKVGSSVMFVLVITLLFAS